MQVSLKMRFIALAFSLIICKTIQLPAQQVDVKFTDSLAKAINNEGVDYAIAGNLNKASELFLQALKIKKTIPDYNKTLLAIGYLNLANTKQLLGYADSALYYYKTADSCIKQDAKPRMVIQGAIYVELGDCYRLFNDYQNALSLTKQGIILYESDSIIDYEKLTLAYIKLGSTNYLIGNYKDALASLEKALDLAKSHQLDMIKSIYNNMGRVYSQKNEYTTAIDYFLQSEKLYRTSKREQYRYFTVLVNMGLTYFRMGDYNKSEKYYLRAVQKLKEFNFTKSYSLSNVYNNLGVLKIATDSIDKAIEYFINSLETNNSGTWNRDIRNFDSRMILSSSNAVSSFEGIGNALLKRSRKNNSLVDAKQALEMYKKAISYFEDIRFRLSNEDDKFIVSNRFHQLYEKAVEASFECMKSDCRYIDESFGLISKSKSAILHEMINRTRNETFVGIPQDIQNKEKELRLRIGGLSEQLYEAYRKTPINTAKVKRIEEQIFTSRNEYNDVIRSIKDNYPMYYSLRYDTSMVSIERAQSLLKSDQVLIEYIKTDSLLFSIAISADSVMHNAQKLSPEFYKNYQVFKDELDPGGFEKLSLENVSRFAQASNYLYQLLIKPYEDQIKNRSIIISPYGELNSIPFNTLISYIPDDVKGFYDLPYLISGNPVSYTLSSKILFDQVRTKRLFRVSSLSVVPNYSQDIIQDLQLDRTYRENLYELPGALNEAQSIQRIFKGELISDGSATENKFKKIAGNYDLLHLAMHTYINNENPSFSKLIFTRQNDTIEDGYLNAFEIYNLSLNCRLAILSACSSSDGMLVGGEGLISIARGFHYTGCPTILATQWRVDDESGSLLIKLFAENINRGNDVANALQQAQLDFLKNTDPLRSHPYFWASYQAIGSTEPITYSWLTRVIFYIITVLVFGLVTFIYRYKFVMKRRRKIG